LKWVQASSAAHLEQSQTQNRFDAKSAARQKEFGLLGKKQKITSDNCFKSKATEACLSSILYVVIELIFHKKI